MLSIDEPKREKIVWSQYALTSWCIPALDSCHVGGVKIPRTQTLLAGFPTPTRSHELLAIPTARLMAFVGIFRMSTWQQSEHVSTDAY